MKKQFIYFIIFSLVFFIIPFFPVESAVIDVLIKGDESTVYYYASDGKRYVFPNNKTYDTWFTDYSNVTIVSTQFLATIPLSGNITYRPGVKMVKIQTDPKTYAVSRGGILRWVETEEVAEALYGSDWNTKIDDVPDTFFVNYQIGDPIESADDYDSAAEMSSTTTINDDKDIEKSENALVSDTGGVVEEPEPEPVYPEEGGEPEPEIVQWENIRITELDTRQQSPALIALDSKYAAVWTDNLSAQDEVNISFFDTDGELESGPFIATQNSSESIVPSIAQSSLDIGIVWEDNATSTPLRQDIFFMRVDEDGNRIVTQKKITDVKIGDSVNPKIAWNGSEFGVVWWDPRIAPEENYLKGSLYYQRITGGGSLVGDNTRITTGLSSQFVPSLIWGDDEFAAVWSDDRNEQKDIYFVRFNRYGSMLGDSDVRITETENDSLNPSVVWDGSSYGVVWEEKAENTGSTGEHYEIYYQKIDSSGEKVRDAVRLTTKDNGDSEEPKIVLNNGKYGVVWTDYRDSLEKTQSDIYFMEINSDGVIVTSEEKVSDGEGLSFEPAIAVLDGGYGLIYVDDRHGDYEIYSASRD